MLALRVGGAVRLCQAENDLRPRIDVGRTQIKMRRPPHAVLIVLRAQRTFRIQSASWSAPPSVFAHEIEPHVALAAGTRGGDARAERQNGVRVFLSNARCLRRLLLRDGLEPVAVVGVYHVHEDTTVTRTWLKISFGALGAVGGLVSAIPAYSHHSFAAYYFEDRTITIEGTLVELDYRNPHVWIHIAAQDNNGRVGRVSAEWSNPSRLSQQAITKDTLKPGDRLIMTGSPPRDPTEYKMHVKRIERPADGWKWIGRGQPR